MNAYYYVQEYFEKITEIQLRKIHWLWVLMDELEILVEELTTVKAS